MAKRISEAAKSLVQYTYGRNFLRLQRAPQTCGQAYKMAKFFFASGGPTNMAWSCVRIMVETACTDAAERDAALRADAMCWRTEPIC